MNPIDALERAFTVGLPTLFCIGAIAGLSWWIWNDAPSRAEVSRDALVTAAGTAGQALAMKRHVLVDLQPAPGRPGPTALAVYVDDPHALAARLQGGPHAVVARVPPAMLERSGRHAPTPAALELSIDGQPALALDDGLARYEQRRGAALLERWFAGAGIAVSVVVLLVVWVPLLRR